MSGKMPDKRVDEFFDKDRCERCGNELKIRTMSFFKDEIICGDCDSEEQTLMKRMRDQGLSPSDYEGCGTIPDV